MKGSILSALKIQNFGLFPKIFFFKEEKEKNEKFFKLKKKMCVASTDPARSIQGCHPGEARAAIVRRGGARDVSIRGRILTWSRPGREGRVDSVGSNAAARAARGGAGRACCCVSRAAPPAAKTCKTPAGPNRLFPLPRLSRGNGVSHGCPVMVSTGAVLSWTGPTLAAAMKGVTIYSRLSSLQPFRENLPKLPR